MTTTDLSRVDVTSVLALGGADTGATLWLTLVQGLLSIGVYVWTALALSAVFRKAGVEVWKAWVPVVNAWTLFTLAGMRGWWAVVIAGASAVAGIASVVISVIAAGSATQAGFAGDRAGATAAFLGGIILSGVLFTVVGVFALVLHIRMLLRLNPAFGLGLGFVVLGALVFPVWASIVGWGSARWLGLPDREASGAGAPGAARSDADSRTASPFTLAGASSATPAAPGAFAPVPPAAPAASPFAAAPPVPPLPSTSPGAAAAAPASDPAAAPVSAGLVSHTPWAPPPPPVDEPAYEQVPAAQPVVSPSAQPAPVLRSPEPVAPVAAAAPAAAPAVAPAPAGPSEEIEERTVLAARRQAGWSLALPDGSSVHITGDAVVLGRNPVAPADAPHAQVVAIADATRTVSKTHALLRRVEQTWVITDLASTNGVFLVDGETETEVSGAAAVSSNFMLGDAALTLNEA